MNVIGIIVFVGAMLVFGAMAWASLWGADHEACQPEERK